MFLVDVSTPLKLTLFVALPVFVAFLRTDFRGAFAFEEEGILTFFALAKAVAVATGFLLRKWCAVVSCTIVFCALYWRTDSSASCFHGSFCDVDIVFHCAAPAVRTTYLHYGLLVIQVRAKSIYLNDGNYNVSATCVCSLYYNYAIDKIEAVQRKFTQRLKGCKDTD